MAVLFGLVHLCVLLPIVVKAFFLHGFLEGFIGEGGFDFWSLLINDGVVVLAMLTLSFISFLTLISRTFAVFLRVVVVSIWLIYVADLVVLIELMNRLTFHDFLKYAPYLPEYLAQTDSVIAFGVFISLCLLFIVLYLFLKPEVISIGYKSIGILLLTTTIISSINTQDYVHKWLYLNVFTYNSETLTESRLYSDQMLVLLKDYVNERRGSMVCDSKPRSKPNIILVMVESLSSYQSKFFSGLNDWTPRIDELARENAAYLNFHANGFTTEDGELALLKGQWPVYSPGSFTLGGGTSFDGYFGRENSLPAMLKNYGYYTQFLTSSDLGFSNTGVWAQSLGFDEVRGAESFTETERFQFNAVSDEVLYSELIQNASAKKQPYFYFVKSATTHHPYPVPGTKQNSAEGSFKYADRAFYELYKALQDSSYFEEGGLLILTGDHRAMLPVLAEEYQVFGEKRSSMMVPLVVIGGAKALTSKDYYQQSDLYNSILSAVSGSICTTPFQGDVFEGVSAEYIMHRPGSYRNQLQIIHNKHVKTVILDGDDTRFKGEESDALAISEINYQRLRQNLEVSGQNIAHAGGRIDGDDYTNTMEAIDLSLQKGFLYVEIDFNFTSDGELVCLHDWGEGFEKLYGYPVTSPITYESFRGLKTLKGFTPCTLESLFTLMDKSDHFKVVTDFKTDNLHGLAVIAKKRPDLITRFIPQVYANEEYTVVKALGYREIIYTLYLQYELDALEVINQVRGKDFYAITMPFYRVLKEEGLVVQLKKLGFKVFTHTINEQSKYNTLKSFYAIDAVYTDDLRP